MEGNQLRLVYNCNITSLTPNTTYYVRAYAITDVSTTYGKEKSFPTGSGLPTITTKTIATSDVTPNSFVYGDNVTDEWDAVVTERGICWNTTGSPTINDSHSSSGIETENFTYTIAGVSTHSETYYIRAYATKVYGTNFGEDIEQKILITNPYMTTT